MNIIRPEILILLIFLIIPVIVHLFNFRKFRKIPFTNVKLLKISKQKNRKTQQLKKYILLTTRLLALAAVITAFAQPNFFTKKNTSNKKNSLIYLDNSLSLQLKGQKGELLKQAIVDISELGDGLKNYILVTNDEILEFYRYDNPNLELKKIGYSASGKSLKSVLLGINSMYQNDPDNYLNDLYIISDFQESWKEENLDDHILEGVNYNLVPLNPVKKENISIDSVWISEVTNENIELGIRLTKYGKIEDVAIGLYDSSEYLISKSTVVFEDGLSSAIINKKLPLVDEFEGILKLQDNNLLFDNNFYFNLINSNIPNVTVIQGEESNGKFLERIYDSENFNTKYYNLGNLDFNSIYSQNIVIVNELEQIEENISEILSRFVFEGGKLLIIPSKNAEIGSYNNLLSKLNLSPQFIKEFVSDTIRVSGIHYSHPILKDVFEKKVNNFSFPLVYGRYANEGLGSSILEFQNKEGFLMDKKIGKGELYLFSSPLNELSSNFINSSLVVPVFYNVAKYSISVPKIYYSIDSDNELNMVNKSKNSDKVLSLSKDGADFIPLQKIDQNKISFEFDGQLKEDGFYHVIQDRDTLRTLSFNYQRSESKLSYLDLKEISNKDNVNVFSSFDEMIDVLGESSENSSFWKILIGVALLLVLFELLFLRFLKI